MSWDPELEDEVRPQHSPERHGQSMGVLPAVTSSILALIPERADSRMLIKQTVLILAHLMKFDKLFLPACRLSTRSKVP